MSSRQETTNTDEIQDEDEDSRNIIIEGRGIKKTYGSRLPFTRSVEVLTGADIDIKKGEIVGIVGENGSGKSTLMKILVGVLDPDSGKVKKDGKIGWCPQESLLYDRLTVNETFRLFGEGYGMTKSEIREAKKKYGEKLGFEEYFDYKIKNLSGGNRQKINLSIALMHDPDVLLLDEPYTGFDWETYLEFWDLTDELVEQGTGIAIISHFVNEKKNFDRIYELRNGKLHEQEMVEVQETDQGQRQQRQSSENQRINGDTGGHPK